MKYLVVLAVVALAIWIWRNNRRDDIRDSAKPPPAAVPSPQAMVRCAHCGLHLPAADAVKSGDRMYCSAAHHRASQG